MSSASPRHKSVAVRVGGVTVGGGAPIVVQSMTNTDTADAEATARQVAALAAAGSELVRITVDRDEAAAAVPHIKDRLRKLGVNAPIIGDFHYIGHKLLADHPACAEALDKNNAAMALAPRKFGRIFMVVFPFSSRTSRARRPAESSCVALLGGHLRECRER